MAEYIDKELLIGALKNREECLDCTDTDCVDCMCDFIAYIVPSDVAEVRHGKWSLDVEKGSCYDYHVTAHCSKCGWEWIGKDSECVGNNKYVFSAFIQGNKEIAEQFALDNAKQCHLYNYCPNCGAEMINDDNIPEVRKEHSGYVLQFDNKEDFDYTKLLVKIGNIITEYSEKHELAKECGSEYIMQDDEAQVDALDLVCNIFDMLSDDNKETE